MIIKRNIFKELCGQVERLEVTVLLGARQVGKTFLMEELRKYCEEKGFETLFLNLEIPSDLRELTGSEEAVFRKLTEKRNRILFIDEFHYLENGSRIFKAIYDSRLGIKIFASGSSSIEIHTHLKESLAGRLWKSRIYPLTFLERSQDPSFQAGLFYQFGGLPGLLNESSDENRVKLLEMMVETYISKDIKSLVREENVRAFNHMLYLLAQNQGSLVTVSSLSREIGLSEPTVKKHLHILSETYICYALTSYSRNLANELKKSQKYYLYDLGIRNLFLKDFRPVDSRDDAGVIGETFVLHHLIPQMKGNVSVHFWRTKRGDEVDFVIVKNQIPYPIEVKTRAGRVGIPEGMKRFIDAYPEVKEGIVYCRDVEDALDYKGVKIEFLPWERAEKVSFLQRVL